MAADSDESERSSRLLVDSIPSLVAFLTTSGEVDFVNRQILEYTGWPFDELKQWGTNDIIHLTTVQTSSRSSRNRSPRVLFTDIDDRKHADDAIRASERNLRQMTETIPEMLWSASPTGAIDHCNTRFLEYTGLSLDDVRRDGWQRSIHPDDAARVGPIWMACVATGAQYRVEVRTFHAADRTYRLCAVTALPLLDEQGHILKWHGTIVDMHDWKQAQDELRNTQAALAHATRVTTMGELTASIAHEVNQPLSGIVTNANTCLRMLATDPPDIDGARETARRTIRDGNRAAEVIERLRALFRKEEVTTDAVNLNDAIREVIAWPSEIQESVSSRRVWTGSSRRFTRRRSRAWGWDCPSAARLSRGTTAVSGRH